MLVEIEFFSGNFLRNWKHSEGANHHRLLKLKSTSLLYKLCNIWFEKSQKEDSYKTATTTQSIIYSLIFDFTSRLR